MNTVRALIRSFRFELRFRALVLTILTMAVGAGQLFAQNDAQSFTPSLSDTLYNMAQEISQKMKAKNLKRVAIFEFTNDTQQGESLGTDYGLLGKYCAEELERDLFNLSGEDFAIVDQRRLQTALKEREFTIQSLGSTEALKQLSESLNGLPAVVVGSIIGREGSRVKLRFKLVETSTGDLIARSDVTAALVESEWAMLGRSGGIMVKVRQTAAEKPNEEDRAIIENLDEQGKGPHPLSDPNFPYRIRLVVNGQERQGVFHGNKYYVPVRDGETYDIYVEIRRNERRLVRLLVDGLNTLPEKETTGPPDFKEIEVSGKRVSLNSARPWVMDPKGPQGSVYAVRGFVTSTGKQGQLDQFKVVAAEKSLAARQNFTSNIGIISAAFYSPHFYVPPNLVRRDGSMTFGAAIGSPGGVGTDRGQRVNVGMETVDATPGNLVAVVHVHYVDYDALENLSQP